MEPDDVMDIELLEAVGTAEGNEDGLELTPLAREDTVLRGPDEMLELGLPI